MLFKIIRFVCQFHDYFVYAALDDFRGLQQKNNEHDQILKANTSWLYLVALLYSSGTTANAISLHYN